MSPRHFIFRALAAIHRKRSGRSLAEANRADSFAGSILFGFWVFLVAAFKTVILGQSFEQQTSPAILTRGGPKTAAKAYARGLAARISLIVALALAVGSARGADVPMYIAASSGRSMLPTMPVVTRVLIEEVPFDQIRQGDIIVYRNDWLRGAYICHRVVRRGGILEKGWVCRGDNNRLNDPGLCTKKNFIGRVQLWFP